MISSSVGNDLTFAVVGGVTLDCVSGGLRDKVTTDVWDYVWVSTWLTDISIVRSALWILMGQEMLDVPMQ